MPPEQVTNWAQVGHCLDELLRRPPAQALAPDLVRARAAAEAQLEQDAQAYGDFPPELAEQVLAQVTRLAVRLAQLRSKAPKPGPTRESLGWPIEPVVVTSLFGRRIHPLTRLPRSHGGVDLAAEDGQLVSAAGQGTVSFAGWNAGYGQQIELEHPGGLVTRYGHLSQLLVESGLKVEQGDPIALAGSTGTSTGPHLHFEVLRHGAPCDPLLELRPPLADEAARLPPSPRTGARMVR